MKSHFRTTQHGSESNKMAFRLSPSGETNSNSSNEHSTVGAMVLTAFMTTATQPIAFVRLLVQVGHEPLPPAPARSFLGTRVMRLPSFFKYANHIRKLEGWTGLYRGLLPRVYSSMVGTLVNSTVLEALSCNEAISATFAHEENMTTAEELTEFAEETCKLTVAKCSALVLSHPFYVISIRMMVQFVGKETLYSGLRSSVKEIYNNEGIIGFFSGLFPRILSEIISLWLFRSACFFLSKYVMNTEFRSKKEVQVYTSALCQWISGVFTYPLGLVSHMMIVNHVGLVAGEPPAMPLFFGWVDCFRYLRSTGNLWRGTSMFRRTVSKVSGK